jgi:hypothetical protein
LEEIVSENEELMAKKTQKFWICASIFSTLQLGIGYYGIYQVEWLGWDPVEPITYSFAQGGFICGMLYVLRTR